MIGADTNILLRALVPEGTSENERAGTFFVERSTDDPLYVGLIVVAELVWVLERRYGYSRHQAAGAVRYLLQSPDIVVERAELVESAIDRVDAAGTDIADELIAATNTVAGCRSTVTFDKVAAKRVPGMELLK